MKRRRLGVSWRIRISSSVFGLVLSVNAAALTDIERWRDELSRVRILAEYDVPQAYKRALKLEASAPSELNPNDEARLWNTVARIEVYAALVDKAAEHIKLARGIAVNHDDKIGQIEADLNAALNVVNQGKIDELIAVTTRSMKLLEGIDQPRLLSEAMLRIGMMYRRIGQFDDSITLGIQAMEAAKNSNDPLALAYAYQGLAIAFDTTGRYLETKDHFAKMREQAQAGHSKLLEGFAALGLGNVAAALGDIKAGERLIREGIALHRAMGAPFSMNHGLYTLAENLRKQGRYRETISVLNEVVKTYEKYPNRIGLWYALNTRSANYQSLGNLKAAQADAERAYGFAKDIGFTLYITESSKHLAALATVQGDFRRAYHLLREAEDIVDKEQREKNSKRILELAERYQAESKQREIEALKRRNQLQSTKLQQKELQQWLSWTVSGGSTIMLLGAACFLLRLRRSHHRLELLHSQLQNSQQSLQSQTGILRSILDSMGDGVSVVDEHGDLILMNPAGEKILGQAVQKNGAVTQPRQRHYYLPDTLTLLAPDELPLAKAIRGESCDNFEVYLRDSWQIMGCWLSVTARPLTDKHGNTLGGVQVFSDVTERKRAEQSIRELNAGLEQRVYDRTLELRQQTRYLRTLIDMLPMWTWFKDTENRYLVSNQAHAIACGHTVYGMVGKSDSDLWPKEIAWMNQADDSEVINCRSGKHLEQYFPDETGGAWMEIYKAAVVDEDGVVLGTVGVARDISAQKASEIAREQALTEAKRLAQMRSDFLAQMSHELRTPLNGILGYAQILMQEPAALSQRQLGFINVIRQSGEHLLTLISDILDYAKIEAGKLLLVETDIQLEVFLQIIASMKTLLAQQKDLVFELQTTSDLPHTVRGDDRRLRQVLLNLLSNAIKFTDHGHVFLRVSALQNNRLRFEVHDTGIGIGADQLERIFLPFEQAGDTMKHAGGTGLGLAISRYLVRLMGGDIEVYSRPGVGSVFSFELEMAVIESGATEAEAKGRISGYSGPRKRILVVDDISENRAVIFDMLTLLDFQMFEASDGKQALADIHTIRPDLIVMDTVMPEMNGLDASRQIRKMPGFEHVPIIGVSASTSSDNQSERLEAGMDIFISKPIDFSVFLEFIGQLLELNWLYDSSDLATASAKPKLTGPWVVPSLEKLRELHQLALMGNMRDISAWAFELTASDSSYQPFANHLLFLSNGYQSKAILKLVESVLEQGTPS